MNKINMAFTSIEGVTIANPRPVYKLPPEALENLKAEAKELGITVGKLIDMLNVISEIKSEVTDD